jgi:hypothetical protein
LDDVNLPVDEERWLFSEQLGRMIRGHITAEDRSLGEHKELRNNTGDPMLESLIRKVLIDKEHHYAMLNRLAEQFEYELEPRPHGAPMAASAPPRSKGRSHALEMVKALARHERDGARKLRGVAK